MHPILITVFGFPITSFGFFLVISYLTALFFIWRLTNVYQLDKEKILDLFLIGTLASLIGGRIFFVLENISLFQPYSRIFAFAQYPGFDFWGGFITATIVIAALCRRFKLQFWQVADIAIVGLIAGLVPGAIGCLLGSCHSGYVSSWPVAVTQVGLIDKRFPIQIIEAIIYALMATYLWRISLKFHFVGKVALVGAILFAATNFFLGFFRADQIPVLGPLSWEQILSILVILISWILFYRLSKRSLGRDLSELKFFFTSSRSRGLALSRLKRTCYNLVRELRLFVRSIFRKINVRPTPKKF